MTEMIRRRWAAMSGAGRLQLVLAMLAVSLCLVLALAYNLGPDTDGDGMADAYETFFGLNPADPADAALDTDADDLVNLTESALWTDPFAADTDADGWSDAIDAAPVSRAYIRWGDPRFISGDEHRYVFPPWLKSAFKAYGEWTTNPPSWHASDTTPDDAGGVSVDFDRALLSTDLMMDIRLLAHQGGSLYVHLYDTNYTVIATNIAGNINPGNGTTVIERFSIPLQAYPAAAGVSVHRGVGAATVYESLFYIDQDGDGLDLDQEAQIGTSDLNPDSDTDGLSDGWEVLHGFDPTWNDGRGVPQSGLRLWVQADKLALADGQAVDAWPDESGAAHTLTQSQTTQRPLFRAQAANGLPAVDFDGANDFLGGDLGAVGTSATIIVVCRFDQASQPSGDYDYVARLGNPQAWQIASISRCAAGYDPAWTDSYYSWMGGGSYKGPVLAGQEWAVLTAVHDSATPAHQLLINGQAATVQQYNGQLALGGAIELGRLSTSGYTGHHLDGQIAELLVYDRALTPEERAGVDNYLRAKYVINRAPTVDAGVDAQTIEGATLQLLGSASDDGVPGPLSIQWSMVAGPGSVAFADASTLQTTATFNQPGAYLLRLTASDGNMASSDDIEVVVSAAGSENVPLTALRLWLKADEMIATNGQPILAWPDRSGGNHTLSQSQSVTAPAYAAAAANGRPAVQFDGANDFIAGNLGAITGSVTIITVCRFDNLAQPTADYDYVLNLGDDDPLANVSVSRCATGYAPAWDNRYYARMGATPGSFKGPVLPGQVWMVFSAVHSATGTVHSVWLNGRPETVDQYQGALTLTGQLELGCFAKPGYMNHYLAGAIAEVLVYAQALSDADRRAIETYLNGKYALNREPDVSAGADIRLVEGQTAALQGIVSDDGNPPNPGAVASLWTKLAGPGTVAFADAAAPQTTASFGTPGVYLLRLSASDGVLQAWDDLEVVVATAGSTNVPLAGLRLWLKADEVLATNTQPIATWPDRSGQGHDLIQATPSAAPAYAATAANGRPAVHFDGANDFVAGNLGAITGNVTIITVCRFDNLAQSAGDFDYVLNLGDDAPFANVSISRCATGYAPAWDNRYYARMGTTPGSFKGPVLPGQTWMVLSAAHSATGTVHSVWLNGRPEAVDQYQGALTLSGELELGRFARPGFANHYFNGGLAELLVFDRPLANAERQTIEAYLKDKYAINHAPTVDAGQDDHILAGHSVTLQGSVSDDGQPTVPGTTTSLWSQASGPGTVAFVDPTSPQTTASFSQPGAYVLRLTASDSALAAQDDMTVIVSAAGSTNVPLPGLRLWLKADEMAALDGAPVLAWPDRSGLGHDLAQDATAWAPAYAATAANGLPAVLFDGANDFVAGNIGAITGNVTLVTVCRFDYLVQPENDFDYLLNLGDDAPLANVSISRCASDYAPTWDNRYYSRMGATPGAFKGPVLPGQAWMILTTIHSATGTTHSVWLNGNPEAVEQYQGALTLNGKLELGRFARPGYANHHLTGAIAEVLAYDRPLAEAERNRVESHLANKYAVTLTLGTARLSGVVSYNGAQSGALRVLAATAPDHWSSDLMTAISAPGAYTITGVPVPGTYTLKAWRDANGNGLLDFWEPRGIHTNNPVFLSADASSIDIALDDPDTDDDFLPDYWELLWFGNLDQTDIGDANQDGVINYIAYVFGTDPNAFDTDGDDLTDEEEIMVLGTNPLDRDTDGDGMEDGWEYRYGLNPLGLDTADIAGYWRLDEADGDIALDSSPALNHGTLHGAARVDVPASRGLQFDGQQAFVSIANAASCKPAADFTVSLRANFDARFGNAVQGVDNGHMVLIAQRNTSGDYAYAIYKTGRNSLVFEIASSSGATTVETADDFIVPGAWLRLVGTFDGANMAFYVNGEIVGTAPHAAPLAYDPDSGILFGRGGLAEDGLFAGTLDEVMLLNAALTANQVQSLDDGIMDSDGDGLLNREESLLSNPFLADSDNDGVGDAEEIAIHGTNPMMADTDGDGLSDYDELFVHHTDPFSADSDLDGLSDGWETANNFDPLSGGGAAALAGYWRLDETTGAIATDQSAHGRHGVLAGGCTHVPGWLNGALRFDGVDAAVAVPQTSQPSTALTAVASVRFDARYGNTTSGAAVTNGYMVLLAQRGAPDAFAYAFYKTDRNALVFETGGTTSVARVETADDFVVTGGWYHLSGVWDGTGIAFRVNEQLIGTAPCAGISFAATGLTFGHGPIDDNNGPEPATRDGWFQGTLDEIRLFNAPLTPAQLISLADAARDDDGDGLNNAAEAAAGTSAHTVDTDGDGVSDGEELLVRHTDPLSADTDDDGMEDGWETANGLDPNTLADASLDPDNDGLSNLGEFQHGTDPNNADTDADGLTDGDEVNVWHTNPLDPDTDHDGLPDNWEALHGTNPLVADASLDPDNDGLSNAAEFQAGTDPFNADTDGDGVSDYLEVRQAYSDPLTMDFDGTVEEILALRGTDFTWAPNQWQRQGVSAVCFDRGGRIAYDLNVPDNGHFALQIQVRQYNALSSVQHFDLSLKVDLADSGRTTVTAPGPAVFFLPYLTAGPHTVNIAWHNPVGNSVLEIVSVRLVRYGGPDADNNGLADWVDARQASGLNVVATAVSLTSPLCLEGSSWDAASIHVSASYAPCDIEQQIVVRPGSEKSWFANVLLSPTNPTAINVTALGGTRSGSANVAWQALNILDPLTTNSLIIRKGDALLLTAYPEGSTGGDVTLRVYSGTTLLTNIATRADCPVPYMFERDGAHTVFASYTNTTVATNTSLAVQVVGASFGGDAICLVGSQRQWTCPGIPTENVTIEHDRSLTATASPLLQGGVAFQLESYTVGTYHMTARLGENGPLLDNAAINVLRFDSSSYVAANVVTTFADGSQLIEISIWLSDVPPGLRIDMNVFVGGVVFDDGTVHRVVTAADFNEFGEYRYRLLKGPGIKTSVCHLTRVYDGNTLIGF